MLTVHLKGELTGTKSCNWDTLQALFVTTAHIPNMCSLSSLE